MATPFDEQIEPLAAAMMKVAADEKIDSSVNYFHVSIAISLKRIADALHGDDQNTGIIRMIGEIADRAYHGQGPTS